MELDLSEGQNSRTRSEPLGLSTKGQPWNPSYFLNTENRPFLTLYIPEIPVLMPSQISQMLDTTMRIFSIKYGKAS